VPQRIYAHVTRTYPPARTPSRMPRPRRAASEMIRPGGRSSQWTTTHAARQEPPSEDLGIVDRPAAGELSQSVIERAPEGVHRDVADRRQLTRRTGSRSLTIPENYGKLEASGPAGDAPSGSRCSREVWSSGQGR
jgi:hypothetical protein